MRDISALVAGHGTTQGQQGFDPRADFNEDDTIDNADVSLLQANLGRREDVVVKSDPRWLKTRSRQAGRRVNRWNRSRVSGC